MTHVSSGKSTIAGHLVYAYGDTGKRKTNDFEGDGAKSIQVHISVAIFTLRPKVFPLIYQILDARSRHSFLKQLVSNNYLVDCAIVVISAETGEFEAGLSENDQIWIPQMYLSCFISFDGIWFDGG